MKAPPLITVEEDRVPGDWTLFVTSHGRKAIVGPRILRGNGVLDIDIRHATRESAEQAADKLRTYLAAQGAQKKHRGEVVQEVRPRGHWEL